VIFAAGGITGNGALIEAASFDNVYCIGVDVDQWYTLPEAHPCLLTSAVKLISRGVVDIIAAVDNGTPPIGNYYGRSDLTAFHQTEVQFPAYIDSKLREIADGLADGSITTGYVQ
jgi:basic membrane protein A